MRKSLIAIVLFFVVACATPSNLPANITDAPPSQKPGELVKVSLLCLGEDTAMRMIAAAITEKAWVTAMEKELIVGNCIYNPAGFVVKTEEHIASIVGFIGKGEVWRIETKDKSMIYIFVKPYWNEKKPEEMAV